MSDLTELISALVTAGTAICGVFGATIRFVWKKVDRKIQALEKKQARQERHLRRCQKGRAIKLVVIELLWGEVKQLSPTSPALARSKKLLDDVKAIDTEDDIESEREMMEEAA